MLGGSAAHGLRLDADVTSATGVLRLDYLEEQDLWQLLADCDVVVSLRWPTMGETSGMAIRALSLGKPLVVSDVGWFSELPDSVAAKVPVDEFEIETLAAVLELLAEDDGLRKRMGEAAAEYARRQRTTSSVWPISTLRRSRKWRAGRPCATPFSTTLPRPPMRLASG